jgi:hypothetical protein
MQVFRFWPAHAVGAVARPDRSFPPRPGLTQVAARGVCARPLGPSMPPGNNARPGRPRGCKAGCRAGSLLRGQGCRRFFRRTPGPQGAGQRSRPTRSEGGVASRDRRGRRALRPSRGSGVLDGGGVAAQLAKRLPRRRPARSGQKATTTLAATRKRATGGGRRAQRRAKLAEPAGRSAGPRRARDQGDDVSTTGTPPRGDGGGSNLPGPGRRAGLARGPCSSWWCGCESGASQGRRAVLARDPWPAVRVRPWLPPAGGRGGRIHIRSWPAGGVCPLATQDRKCGTGKAGSGWRRALCARGQTAHRRSRSRSLQWCSRGRIAADWYRDVPPADQGDSGWS